jgi:hypothetical protein
VCGGLGGGGTITDLETAIQFRPLFLKMADPKYSSAPCIPIEPLIVLLGFSRKQTLMNVVEAEITSLRKATA